jgi:flagellar export protein FliJ
MNAARRARRLDIVADLARHRRLAAERALADAKRDLAARRETYEQLCGFRGEYDSPARRGRAGALSPGALQDYDRFRARLDIAVTEQARQLQEAEGAARALEQALADAAQRSESLEAAVDHYQRVASRESLRREQQLIDEIATLNATRR